MFWEKREAGWALPFPGADASVVRRSQRLLVAASRAVAKAAVPLPVQYSAFCTIPSLWALIKVMFFGAIMSVLARFAWGRRILLWAPRFFSNGVFSHAGPTRAQMQATSFAMTFFARGYSDARTILVSTYVPSLACISIVLMLSGRMWCGLARFSDVHVFMFIHNPSASAVGGSAPVGQPPAPDMEATVRVSGPEPGYVATPLLLLGAAATLMAERETLPVRGGVLTPAAAFRGTGLIQRLRTLGISFDVLP